MRNAILLALLVLSSGCIFAQEPVRCKPNPIVWGNMVDAPIEQLNMIEENLEHLLNHAHSHQRAYPPLADGVELISGTGPDFNLSDYVTLIPANNITEPYHVIGVHTHGPATGHLELILYYGDSDIEFAQIPYEGERKGNIYENIHSPLLPANSRIRARLADETGSAQTVYVYVLYFLHD